MIYEIISNSFDWIEKHPTTVSIVKWGILIFIGWVTGIFKWWITPDKVDKVFR